MDTVRFSRSARKHRIGKAHVIYIMDHVQPTVIHADADSDERLLWIGTDDRGVELEVVALKLPGLLLVIHAMPTHYHRRSK